MPPSLKPCDCLFLTGATASGKTAVGVALARRLGAEIVSLDSMAIYRGMDIGTAKPTPEEQGGIAHHLVDVASTQRRVQRGQLRRSGRACGGRNCRPVATRRCSSAARLSISRPCCAASTPVRRPIGRCGRVGRVGPRGRAWRLPPAPGGGRSGSRGHGSIPSDTRRLVPDWKFSTKTGRTISSQQQHFAKSRSAEMSRLCARLAAQSALRADQPPRRRHVRRRPAERSEKGVRHLFAGPHGFAGGWLSRGAGRCWPAG